MASSGVRPGAGGEGVRAGAGGSGVAGGGSTPGAQQEYNGVSMLAVMVGTSGDNSGAEGITYIPSEDAVVTTSYNNDRLTMYDTSDLASAGSSGGTGFTKVNSKQTSYLDGVASVHWNEDTQQLFSASTNDDRVDQYVLESGQLPSAFSPARSLIDALIDTPRRTWLDKTNQRMYVGAFLQGRFTVLDVDTANPISILGTVVDNTNYPYLGYRALTHDPTDELVLAGAWTAGTLAIIDVSDPANPAFVGSGLTGLGANSVNSIDCVPGRSLAVLGDGNNIKSVDYSNPASPQVLQTLDLGVAHGPIVNLPDRDQMVVHGEGKVFLVDITDSSNMQIVSEFADNRYGQVGWGVFDEENDRVFSIESGGYLIGTALEVRVVEDQFTGSGLITGHSPDLGDGSWEAPVQDWTVGSGRVYPSSNSGSGLQRSMAVYDIGISDAMISIDHAVVPNNWDTQQGLVFRFVDENNYWLFAWENVGGTFTVKLWKVEGGSFTEMGSYADTPQVGDIYKVIANGSSIQCLIDGLRVIEVTDSTHDTATKAGPYAYSNWNIHNSTYHGLDNFYATEVDPIPTSPASGGTVTSDNDYWYHTFTEDGTFTVPSETQVDVEVIGGGGAGGGVSDSGGGRAGGGGSGRYRKLIGLTLPAGDTAVTIGSGGTASNADGESSFFGTYESEGGGGGGNTSVGGNDSEGGGGGGGMVASNTPTAAGIGTQGDGATGTGASFAGGGGGSAGDGLTADQETSGGPGTVCFDGVTRAGGGGGGGRSAAKSLGAAGGGSGGRGDAPSDFPTDADANTGSGGGGSGFSSDTASGGSGITIVRFRKDGTYVPEMSGLTAYYDADDTDTLTLSGSDVTQWNDQSGNELHLTSEPGAYYQTGTDINGRNAINNADATANYMRVEVPTPIGQTEGVTLYAAFRATGDAPNDSIPVTLVNTSSAAKPIEGYNTTRVINGTAPGSALLMDPVNRTKMTVWCLTLEKDGNGAGSHTLKEYINGVLTYNANISATWDTTGQHIYVMTRNTSGTTQLIGDIGTVAVCDGVHDISEVEEVSGYLMDRWGVDQLAFHYDFSDTSSITDTGGDITAVSDQTDWGLDLSTEVGTPRTGDTTQNGLNVVDIANGENMQVVPTPDQFGLYDYGITLYAVFRATGGSTYDAAPIAMTSTNLGRPFDRRDGVWVLNSTPISSGWADMGAENDWCVYAWTIEKDFGGAGTHRFTEYKNGLQTKQVTSAGSYVEGLTNIGVGQRQDGVTQFIGSVGEIKGYNGGQDADTVAAESAALMEKWGISFDPIADMDWYEAFWADGSAFTADQSPTDGGAIAQWVGENSVITLDAGGVDPTYDEVNPAFNDKGTIRFLSGRYLEATAIHTGVKGVVIIYRDETGVSTNRIFDEDGSNTDRLIPGMRFSNSYQLFAGGSALQSAPYADGATVMNVAYIDNTASYLDSNGVSIYSGANVGNESIIQILLDADASCDIAFIGVTTAGNDPKSQARWGEFVVWANEYYGLGIS